MYYAIIADIGGTNSRFELYLITNFDVKLVKGAKASGTLIHEQAYVNIEHRTFTEVFRKFLTESNHLEKPLHVASLAVAGWVVNNSVSFTNNKWKIDGNLLAQEFGITKVELMNDFVSNTYGVLSLDHNDRKVIRSLQDAPVVPNAPIACIGAGTGLGSSFATNPANEYSGYPSEGGHADFAARNDLEIDLLQYLLKQGGQHRVSTERVVSGPGLGNLFEFLIQHPDFESLAASQVVAEFFKTKHKGKFVSMNVGKDLICTKAMEMFVSAYGSEAGVSALKFLPYGGLYLTGGVTAKNIDFIDSNDNDLFLTSFYEKGRLSPALKQIPIYVVLDQNVGLKGAHLVAMKLLRNISISSIPTSVVTCDGYVSKTSLVQVLVASCFILSLVVTKLKRKSNLKIF